MNIISFLLSMISNKSSITFLRNNFSLILLLYVFYYFEHLGHFSSLNFKVYCMYFRTAQCNFSAHRSDHDPLATAFNL